MKAATTASGSRLIRVRGGFIPFKADPTRGAFNLEWTAPTATCVICSECGYVHWFLQS